MICFIFSRCGEAQKKTYQERPSERRRKHLERIVEKRALSKRMEGILTLSLIGTALGILLIAVSPLFDGYIAARTLGGVFLSASCIVGSFLLAVTFISNGFLFVPEKKWEKAKKELRSLTYAIEHETLP